MRPLVVVGSRSNRERADFAFGVATRRTHRDDDDDKRNDKRDDNEAAG